MVYGMEIKGKMDKEIIELVKSIELLHKQAYYIYAPLVDDLCSRPDASVDEVEHMLDYLLDFCATDEILELYKKVCRSFFDKYPKSIADYILIYREMYETDEDEISDE